MSFSKSLFVASLLLRLRRQQLLPKTSRWVSVFYGPKSAVPAHFMYPWADKVMEESGGRLN